MKPAHVIGQALWAPGYANVDAWLAEEEDPSVERPLCEIVHTRLKRGISLLTRMLVEVAADATRRARVEASEVATVFGSAYGEIQTAVAQMRMMGDDDGVVSPARFKNSVHNTAAGLLSLATANRGFTTALAAGPRTVAFSLLEAVALLEAGAPVVVVAVADEPLPEPLCTTGHRKGGPAAAGLASQRAQSYEALGVAFALSPEPGPAKPLGRIVNLCRGRDGARPSIPERFAANPCAPALALIEALGTGRTGRIALELAGRDGGSMNIELAA